MPTVKFPNELMQRIVCEDTSDEENVEIISDEIYDTRRWSTCHELIFRKDGKVYQTTYSQGATEQQDESPFEYDGDEIECVEMVEKEVTKTVWVPA